MVMGNQKTYPHTERMRQRENSNSKTSFYKDCSLGSVKTKQLVLAKPPVRGGGRERDRQRQTELNIINTQGS